MIGAALNPSQQTERGYPAASLRPPIDVQFLKQFGQIYREEVLEGYPVGTG